MKELVALLILAFGLPGVGWAGQGPGAATGQRFAWLEGCWAGERGTARFREVWMVASPDLLLGMGVTNEGTKPAEFEYFRIEIRAGQPAYVAQPRGVPPTVFTLNPAASSADHALFVNPAHDFPKRISYRRVDPSNLQAFVDGGENSRERVEYPMKRVPCPGPR
jgi:hypothetical protein